MWKAVCLMAIVPLVFGQWDVCNRFAKQRCIQLMPKMEDALVNGLPTTMAWTTPRPKPKKPSIDEICHRTCHRSQGGQECQDCKFQEQVRRSKEPKEPLVIAGPPSVMDSEVIRQCVTTARNCKWEEVLRLSVARQIEGRMNVNTNIQPLVVAETRVVPVISQPIVQPYQQPYVLPPNQQWGNWRPPPPPEGSSGQGRWVWMPDPVEATTAKAADSEED